MEMSFVIDENSPQIEQPSKITLPLKPHQLAMIKAMKTLEENDKVSIVTYHSSHHQVESYFKTSFGSLCDKVGR